MMKIFALGIALQLRNEANSNIPWCLCRCEWYECVMRRWALKALASQPAAVPLRHKKKEWALWVSLAKQRQPFANVVGLIGGGYQWFAAVRVWQGVTALGSANPSGQRC